MRNVSDDEFFTEIGKSNICPVRQYHGQLYVSLSNGVGTGTATRRPLRARLAAANHNTTDF